MKEALKVALLAGAGRVFLVALTIGDAECFETVEAVLSATREGLNLVRCRRDKFLNLRCITAG